MTKQKIILADILVALIWTMLLFFFGKIYKTEAAHLDINPIYLISFTIILTLIPFYIYFYVTKKPGQILVLTVLTITVSTTLSISTVDAFISYLQNKYYDGSAMGWTFKFRWLDLILINLFSLTIIELTSKALNKINGRHASRV